MPFRLANLGSAMYTLWGSWNRGSLKSLNNRKLCKKNSHTAKNVICAHSVPRIKKEGSWKGVFNRKHWKKNQKRVNGNLWYYKLRQQIIGHQFGTFKWQWGFTYMLMKGKQHVLTEVNLLQPVKVYVHF
jgi:hypothetical protein